MNIDPAFAADYVLPSDLMPTPAASPLKDFGIWLDKEVSSVNSRLISSEIDLRKVASGEVDNLHQVMVSMEEAKLSFQLAMQVRNRLLEAYQEVLRMQI